MAAVSVATVLPPCLIGGRPLPARGIGVPYRFFDAAEANFIEAACERLIPADHCGPGALDAGVPRYMDEHLSGPWGAGAHVYRNGAWQPGTPSAARLTLAPAELFRKALHGINQHFAAGRTTFSGLTRDEQDAFLVTLETVEATFGGVPATAFFDMLLKMTAEGFLSHPQYGANRDRVAWRITGFPGAFACARATI